MAFANYTELKLSIIKWSNRSDIDLLVNDFINLCEKDMFKNTKIHQSLELREMETTATAEVSTKFFALPDGFASMRSTRLVLADGSGKLIFKPSNGLVRRPSTGRPNYFTVGAQIELDITPDQTYTVEFVYANDQEKALMYQGLYNDAIDGANEADKEGRYGATPYARIEGSTP